MSAPITSKGFLKWLTDNGIIPSTCRHVIIEAKVGDVVRVYIEGYGTTNLMSVEGLEVLRSAPLTVVDEEAKP
jgi:hypothetical protein